jgi:hypothetical protein
MMTMISRHGSFAMVTDLTRSMSRPWNMLAGLRDMMMLVASV